MARNFDVLVAGAGIVGVSTALHLLMRGLKVGLVDRRGAGLETSYGNAGVIANSYIMPFGFPDPRQVLDVLLDRDTAARIRYASLPRYLPWLLDFYWHSLPKNRANQGRLLWPLLRHAYQEHLFLMHNTDAARHMHMTGRVTLYRSEKGFAGGVAERRLAEELGVGYDVLDRVEFSALEPHLKPAFHKVVRWKDSPRLDNPAAVTAAYADRFVREGGTLLIEDIEALQQIRDGQWRVITGQGCLEAGRLVMCLGPWSKALLGQTGYHFPMASKRGYHQHYRPQGTAVLGHAITDAAWGYVMAPMERGIRLTSGAEMTDIDAPSQPVQLERLLPHARELFPLADAVDSEPWYGSRPCFADSLPVIGAAPHHANLWFNFGHGHMGMTLGPVTGRLIADMMTEATTICDPAPYRAERFRV